MAWDYTILGGTGDDRRTSGMDRGIGEETQSGMAGKTIGKADWGKRLKERM